MGRHYQGRTFAAVALCVLAAIWACAPWPSAFAESDALGPPVGRVSIHQLSIAFIGSAAVGGGALSYHGRTYRFKATGLGVGGVGASRLDAGGKVYGLHDLPDFEGPYLEAHSGFAVGPNGRGFLWLRNAHGVIMQLRAHRSGLALTLGADGMLVKFDQ